MTIWEVAPGASIQAAINSAGWGDWVHLQTGTHAISAAIEPRAGIRIYGDGPAATTVQLANAANCNVFQVLNKSNIQFDSFTIDGNAPNQTNDLGTARHGIALYKARNVTIRDMSIIFCEKDSVYVGVQTFGGVTYGPSEYVKVYNCYFALNMRHGMGITSGKHVRIWNCTFYNINDFGIDIEPNSTLIDYCQDIWIYNNVFDDIGLLPYSGAGTASCIGISASGVDISDIYALGNYFYTDQPDGCRGFSSSSPTANKIKIIGNIAMGNIVVACVLSSTTHDVTIFGNRFDTDFPWLDYKNNISITGDVSDVSVRGNYLTGAYYAIGGLTTGGHTLDSLTFTDNVTEGAVFASGGGGTYTNITISDNDTIPPNPSTNKILADINPDKGSQDMYAGYVAIFNWEYGGGNSDYVEAGLADLLLDDDRYYVYRNAINLDEHASFLGRSNKQKISMLAGAWSPVEPYLNPTTIPEQLPYYSVFIVDDPAPELARARLRA